jgi:hypothetical protein
MATDHKGNPLHAGKRTNDEARNRYIVNRISPRTGKEVPLDQVGGEGSPYYAARRSGNSRFGREVWPTDWADDEQVHPNWEKHDMELPEYDFDEFPETGLPSD